MLTPASAWSVAASNRSEPRFLLSIYDGTNTWKATSGYCTQMSYPIGVVSVSSVASEVDPIERSLEPAECVVECLSSWLRPILVNNRLKGKTATITFGFYDIAEGSFLAYFKGPIEEITPSGDYTSGTITLSVMDMLVIPLKQELQFAWFNLHPLTCLYDGATNKSVLSRCGMNSSTFVDETSFDPTDSEYTSTISHWCTSRIGEFDIYEKTACIDVINDLCKLMNGTIRANEGGTLSFKRYDSTDTSSVTWTVDDVVEGSFKQDPLDSNVINQVKITYGKSIDGDLYPERTFVLNDTTSQSNFVYPGQTSRIITHEYKSKYCNTWRTLLEDDITDVATSFQIRGHIHSFCGCEDLYPGPQGATKTVSASRPIYLLLDSADGGAPETEIVKVEAVTVTATNVIDKEKWIDWEYGDYTTYTWYDLLDCSSVTRAQFGTTAQAHRGNNNYRTIVWDVTMLVDMATRILERFKNGCPIVELDTPAKYVYLQVGDIVTLNYSKFCAYGKDSGSYDFEIIAKEPDLMGSSPVVHWRLAYHGITATTPTGSFVFRALRTGDVLNDSMAQSRGEQMQAFVSSGMAFSVVSGLNGSIASGVVVSGPFRYNSGTVTHTFTASKDTYISINAYTGHMEFIAVANGAAVPDKDDMAMWLHKVVTDGSGITSSTALYDSYPVPGSKIEAGSGPITYLAQGGAFDSFEHITTTSFDHVDDGATWKKVTDVNASNQCVAASIATGAVTEAKIASAAVTNAKVGENAIKVKQSYGYDTRSSVNRNTNFLHRG